MVKGSCYGLSWRLQRRKTWHVTERLFTSSTTPTLGRVYGPVTFRTSSRAFLVNAYHSLQIALNCDVEFVYRDRARNFGGPDGCTEVRSLIRALRNLGLPDGSFRFTEDPFVPTEADFRSPASVWFSLARSSST